MRILVTGAAGLVGTDVVRLAAGRGHQVVDLGHARLDVTDAAAVAAALERERPEALVNCAGFSDVDGAETRKEEAFRVNGEGAGNLARAAAGAGCRLVHLGSDYVFPGDQPRPRREDDPVAPLSVYGASKLEGERQVAAAGGRALVVRSAWLFGRHGKSFVAAIRRRAEAGESLRVVDDQTGSPTSTVALAEAILDLLETGACGIVHFANRGQASWLELARAVLEELGIQAAIAPIRSEELGRPARRPPYSVLDTSRFERLTGRRPVPWREALARHLRGVGEG